MIRCLCLCPAYAVNKYWVPYHLEQDKKKKNNFTFPTLRLLFKYCVKCDDFECAFNEKQKE